MGCYIGVQQDAFASGEGATTIAGALTQYLSKTTSAMTPDLLPDLQEAQIQTFETEFFYALEQAKKSFPESPRFSRILWSDRRPTAPPPWLMQDQHLEIPSLALQFDADGSGQLDVNEATPTLHCILLFYPLQPLLPALTFLDRWKSSSART